MEICPSCHFPLSENFYFCPNCSKKIKEPIAPVTIGRQIGIYLLSLFLPPLGLFPGIKYLLQKEKKRKIIGIAAIALTILSTIITIWITINLTSQVNNTLNTQLNQYNDLDY